MWLSRNNLWARYVVKYPAFFLTSLCIGMGISANKVTVVGGIVGVVGCLSLALGNYWAGIVGATLICLCKILDYVDGNVARMTGTNSEFGGFLDAVVDFTLAGIIPLSIGFGLFVETGVWVYPFLGGAYAFGKILGYIISYGYKLSFQGGLQEVADESKLMTWGIRITLLDVPVLLVCAITETLPAFLILFTILFAGKAAGTAVTALKEGGTGKLRN